MNNQIHSYSFPLADGCQNSFITALKSKHFLIAGAAVDAERPTSNIHLFKYEEDNPKKSYSQNKTVDGLVYGLFSNEENSKPITIAILKDGTYKLQLVSPDKIGGEQPILEHLYQQQQKLKGIHFKKEAKQFYLWGDSSIQLFDLQKRAKSPWLTSSSSISSVVVDPIHEYLTYSNGREVHICDKKSSNDKYVIRACEKSGDRIIGMDYNPNKQCYLMTCHHESIKFWDVRKGSVPIRCYDEHHNLLTQARYNHSHDELIACAYDDGTVGLLRLHSVCSSPQSEIEDTMVKLYDEHEDSVFQVAWSAFSPWVFASVTYNSSSLVVNIVPNVEKYRILL